MLFGNYLPLEKLRGPSLNNLESPSPKDALCPVWLKFSRWFWRRRFFNLVNIFSLFRNYPPLTKGMAHHLNKLCHVSMKLAQLNGEEIFLISSIIFSLFRNYPLLERGVAFYLSKLKSPSSKDTLCQVWLK